jgi:hypothetical protein
MFFLVHALTLAGLYKEVRQRIIPLFNESSVWASDSGEKALLQHLAGLVHASGCEDDG